MNSIYPLKENESTLHAFCERLTFPYATAKQYFEQMTPNLEMYELSKYFYTFYSELENRKKDTVYNNLLRLYECYTEKVDESRADCARTSEKIQSSNANEKSGGKENTSFIVDLVSALFTKGNLYFQHAQRQSILVTFLNVADKYNQISEAVQGRMILKKFEEYDSEIRNIKEKTKKDKWNIIVITSMITIAIYLILTRIFLDGNWKLFDIFFPYAFTGVMLPVVGGIILQIIENIKNP